ncbi:hypothetical protein C5167_021693 [Papaver somniferum]|uniref:Uncharacterized protein n=1 Tax=Papaver somniferum TaxID=3469 RepID=A0A4Y7JHD2_PAPSO|nr:hypothetical protein C5167_021693 [Papaver somniferum]
MLGRVSETHPPSAIPEHGVLVKTAKRDNHRSLVYWCDTLMDREKVVLLDDEENEVARDYDSEMPRMAYELRVVNGEIADGKILAPLFCNYCNDKVGFQWINEVHGEQYNHGLPLADMSSIFRYSGNSPQVRRDMQHNVQMIDFLAGDRKCSTSIKGLSTSYLTYALLLLSF